MRSQESRPTLSEEILYKLPGDTYGFRRCCEAVRNSVPIEQVASRYTDLRPLGGHAWFTGRCPLPDHEDKTPSFYVYPPGRYWCYGCDRGGDVVQLEFHCGDHGELWEAMISLAVDYGVALPERPRSWFARQERRAPVRDAIAEAKVHAARRRLYRRFFEPLILATEDRETREHDAQLFWETTAPLAEHLVAHMMGAEAMGNGDPMPEDLRSRAAIVETNGHKPGVTASRPLYKPVTPVKPIRFAEMGPPSPRKYVVEGIAPKGHTTTVFGDGGSAKSVLA